MSLDVGGFRISTGTPRILDRGSSAASAGDPELSQWGSMATKFLLNVPVRVFISKTTK